MKITREFAPATICLETKADIEDMLTILRTCMKYERKWNFNPYNPASVSEKAILLIKELTR